MQVLLNQSAIAVTLGITSCTGPAQLLALALPSAYNLNEGTNGGASVPRFAFE